MTYCADDEHDYPERCNKAGWYVCRKCSLLSFDGHWCDCGEDDCPTNQLVAERFELSRR